MGGKASKTIELSAEIIRELRSRHIRPQPQIFSIDQFRFDYGVYELEVLKRSMPVLFDTITFQEIKNYFSISQAVIKLCYNYAEQREVEFLFVQKLVEFYETTLKQNLIIKKTRADPDIKLPLLMNGRTTVNYQVILTTDALYFYNQRANITSVSNGIIPSVDATINAITNVPPIYATGGRNSLTDRINAARAPKPILATKSEPEAESKIYIEEQCSICIEVPPTGYFMNCRHACLCQECYQTYKETVCPICRAKIVEWKALPPKPVEPEPESESEFEDELEAEIESESEVESEVESEFDAEVESEFEAESEVESEFEADVESEFEAESDVEPESEPIHLLHHTALRQGQCTSSSNCGRCRIKLKNWLRGHHIYDHRFIVNLNLRNRHIRRLPIQIGQLTNLRSLDLTMNSLRSLPVEIGQLTKLEHLFIIHNNLTSLPSEIGQLTNLRTLSLTNNFLSWLPDEIGQLINLRWLYLQNNNLLSLPTTIGNLINLQTLALSDNKLTILPAEIGQLDKLKVLTLRGNLLSNIPFEIGRLPNLKILELGNIGLKPVAPSQLTYFDHSSEPSQFTYVDSPIDAYGRRLSANPLPYHEFMEAPINFLIYTPYNLFPHGR